LAMAEGVRTRGDPVSMIHTTSTDFNANLMVSQDLVNVIEQGFALHLDGIHGIAHWARVRANGLRLAQETGANPEVVVLFALLHDSKRLSDGRDPKHGARAAQFAASLQGSQLALPEEELEMLQFACEYHTDGLTEANITVQTCWDADRLDLGRVGIRPDPRQLCTLAARESTLLEWAYHQSRI
jgi:uncharacterized protein